MISAYTRPYVDTSGAPTLHPGLPVFVLLVAFLLSGSAKAGIWGLPGESVLRADLALLVDRGRFELPLSTWPIPRADIEHLVAVVGEESDLPPEEAAALARVQAWLSSETRDSRLAATTHVAGAARPVKFRTFDSTPREEGEMGLAVAWETDRWYGTLQATGVSTPSDGQSVRPDGTYVGTYLGNWYLGGGWLDRWWGPGREGSLILSTNARPMPGISFDRATSVPFETRWLSWLGPWTYSMFLSQMEDDRQDVSKPLFFGQRLTFRPLRGLELGISRTAQFCGEGRVCDWNAFKNMLFGNDNAGQNVAPGEEPGNQMAGFDGRWTPSTRLPLVLYSQWIGEDQQGLVPFKYLGQFGVEWWRGLSSGSQLRVHLEFADTACDWYASPPIYGCAYTQHIFNVEGYRYRGRSVGHSIDADGREIALGFDLIGDHGAHWVGFLRRIDLDRSGVYDPRNQASSVPARVSLAELRYERDTIIGHVSLGAGFEEDLDKFTGKTTQTGQGFLQIEHHFGP
jgi:hypothetical protein